VDVSASAHVITISTALPAASVDYGAASRALKAHVEKLLEQLVPHEREKRNPQ